MSRRSAFVVALGLSLGGAGTAAAQDPMPFRYMDRNNDGVVTHEEWRGSERAFQDRDWNHDGRLSGAELRQGGRRDRLQGRAGDPASREYAYDDWTARGFRAIDRNRDGLIATDEWHFDSESFWRADHNADGVVSRAEFLNEGQARSDIRARAERTDRNGVVTQPEWRGTAGQFDQRDTNRDGRVSSDEIAAAQRQAASPQHSAAYLAGYDRGAIEGRAAGREDKDRHQGWDLEGQRELEAADSGYESRYGSRVDYQAGYREGFRQAYPEGYGPR